MSKLWMETYDLKGKKTRIDPTYQGSRLNPELAEYARNFWKTEKEAKGWRSSWVPTLDQLIFTEDEVIIKAGFARYGDQVGVMYAIKEGKEFAPKIGVNGLATSVYALTSDKKVILPRRSAKVDEPLVYNTFCGWLSTMNIVGKRCEDTHTINDSRLYNALWQTENELTEEASLDLKEFRLDRDSSFLIRSHGGNISFGYVAEIYVSSKEVKGRMLKEQEEFASGFKEHDKIATVHSNDLEQLLRNQVWLQKEDSVSFEPKDTKELILLNETLGGLVLTYERLTEKERPKDLIDYLGNGGIEIVQRPIHLGTCIF